MPWLLPAFIASLIGSAILVWVFGFLYGQHRERHLGLWTCGWLFYTLRFVLLLLDEAWLHWIDMEHLVHVCVLLSGYFLFLGTAAFVHKPVSRGWHLGLVAGLLWIPFSHLADFGFFLTNLPISTFYGLTTIWTGLLILRAPDLVKGGGSLLTGGSFILWGVHKLDYPVLHSVPWFAPWGFLFNALLSFTVAIGMLLTYFQRMQQQLSLSRQRFRNLVEQAGDGLFLHDFEGRLLDVNRQACQSLGYRREELLQLTVADIDLNFAAEDFLEQWRSIGTDDAIFIQGVQRRRDGSTFPVEVRVRRVDDLQHGPCLLALARDVSTRRRVEEALATTNQRLENAQRIGQLGNWEWDLQDNRLSWSAEIYRIFGLPPELGEPSYETFLNAVHPQDRAAVREAVTASLGHNAPYDIEHRVVHPDGSLRYVWERAEVSCDDQGRPLAMFGTVLDVTERKQAEAALRASEEKYHQLFQQFQGLLDGIPDLLLLFDSDLRVVWGNRSAHRIGGELRRLEGAACGDLLQDWGIPCDVSMLVDTFSWGLTEEARLATADGRSWGVKAFPVRDPQGKIIQVILWASDITEKSRLRDEAQRATRLASLGELAAGMAHEINNPNGLILLNLPVIYDCLADALSEFEAAGMEPSLGGLGFTRVRSELPEMLQETQQAARRIKRIVDDLKDFVRQESTESGESFDLNDVVRAATRMLANPIRSATDHFTLECTDSLPPVRGSFQRIEQVVVNLTMNACQALPDRGRKLQMRTSFDPQQGEVLLQVQDEGIGIDPDNLPHLTDPFFTTRRDQGGTGLGLSVSARIVSEHEGRLEFNSTPGRGTIVTLRLPALVKEDSP